MKRGAIIITLVGGGGKTSFMYFIAKTMADFECKVVATTTTKLSLNGPNPGKLVFAKTFNECKKIIKKYQQKKKL